MTIIHFAIKSTKNNCDVLCLPFVPVCLQSTRQERTLLKPFYDRYRLLKQILLLSATANVISTIVSILNTLTLNKINSL